MRDRRGRERGDGARHAKKNDEIDWDGSPQPGSTRGNPSKKEYDFNGNWEPAGGMQWEDKVDQSVTVDYAAVELQGPDPVGLAELWGLWGKVAGLPVSRDGASPHIALNNVDIRFVEATDGRGYGLGGLDLRVADRGRILAAARERGAYVSDDEVSVCGVRFRLIDG